MTRHAGFAGPGTGEQKVTLAGAHVVWAPIFALSVWPRRRLGRTFYRRLLCCIGSMSGEPDASLFTDPPKSSIWGGSCRLEQISETCGSLCR